VASAEQTQEFLDSNLSDAENRTESTPVKRLMKRYGYRGTAVAGKAHMAATLSRSAIAGSRERSYAVLSGDDR